jgi:DUF4097 and DUF4098 domain-containing protein YvlB
MKINILLIYFLFFVSFSAFGSGNIELVNTQELSLDNIVDISILYSSERVSLFMGTTDTLIIKEYMSDDNNRYFARISTSGNSITIGNGRRPFRSIVNAFNRRLEVYLPISYMNNINIRTRSGRIEGANLFCVNITLESSSGNISLNSIAADNVNINTSSGRININHINSNISIKSSSGRIHLEKIQGNISLQSSSGAISIDSIIGDILTQTSSGKIDINSNTGAINASTRSGNISCTVSETIDNITFNTSSGRVELNLPQDQNFNFSSRTSSGRITTPFSDKLSIPVTDRKLVEGVIGEILYGNIPLINIRTNSGSIRVNWI